MQNRYAGDIGDFVKLALLRHVAAGRRLGVAWYLYRDEEHTGDGRHIAYLDKPQQWRQLEPELFDLLASVTKGVRSIEALEAAGAIAGGSTAEELSAEGLDWRLRSVWREGWFERARAALTDADIIFADPDNGLVDDQPKRRSRKIFNKQIPLAEAKAWAEGRTAIIYHHNTRRRGGHNAEVDHWLEQLGGEPMAVRFTAFSCRTFFVLNPDAPTQERVRSFCCRWAGRSVALHNQAVAIDC